MLEMPLLREEVASMTSKFPLEFSIFVILMIGSVMLLRCGFCFSVFVITYAQASRGLAGVCRSRSSEAERLRLWVNLGFNSSSVLSLYDPGRVTSLL